MKALTQALLAIATTGLAILSAHAADVLWRNVATGETYIYLVNGTSITGEGYVRAVPDQNWRIAGVGDFNGDGFDDILWRNTATGENYIYLMNGTSISGEGYIRTVPDQNWSIAGVSDFNGDGRADILWRNRVSGENYLYLMNGVLPMLGEGYLRTVADTNWLVAGVRDFNGDGKADILWRNRVSGENYLYLMNGVLPMPGEGYLRTVADTNWLVAGVRDFNGDGKADILWRNRVSGENYLYLMNGVLPMLGDGYLRTVADTNWQVAGVRDFNGDGKADILWRNRVSGENYLYPMNGLVIQPGEGYLRTVADLRWWPTPASTTATLAWDAVVAANLSGYRVYYGTSPGTYVQLPGQGLNVGNVTTYTVTGLSSGTRYYFAVTAFDSSGNESPYSIERFKDMQ